MDSYIDEIIKAEIRLQRILGLIDEEFSEKLKKYKEECKQTTMSYLQFLEREIEILKWTQSESQEPINLIDVQNQLLESMGLNRFQIFFTKIRWFMEDLFDKD